MFYTSVQIASRYNLSVHIVFIDILMLFTIVKYTQNLKEIILVFQMFMRTNKN